MSLRLNHMWTPDSGTVELPSVVRGTPVADLDTVPMPFWMGTPSVPTRHQRPDYMRHLKESADAAVFAWLLVGALILLGLWLLSVLAPMTPVSGVR
jgi:hypothetical protein